MALLAEAVDMPGFKRDIPFLHFPFLLHWFRLRKVAGLLQPHGLLLTRRKNKGSLTLWLICLSGKASTLGSPLPLLAILTDCRLLISVNSFHFTSCIELTWRTRIHRIGGQGLYELCTDDGAAFLAYRQQTRCDAEPIESVYHDGRIAMAAFRIVVGGVIQARYGDECRKHHEKEYRYSRPSANVPKDKILQNHKQNKRNHGGNMRQRQKVPRLFRAARIPYLVNRLFYCALNHHASPFAIPLPSRARDETSIPLRRAFPFAKASSFAKATEDKTADKTEDKLIRANGFIGLFFRSWILR